MASNTGRKAVIGVCQMTATSDKNANFQTVKNLTAQCKKRGSQVFFF